MIVSIVFLVLAALFTFFGVLKGRKYTWVFSAVRIVGIVLSAILTALLSALIGRVLGGVLMNILPGAIGGDFQNLVTELPSMGIAVEAITAMVVAPILFWPLFSLLYNLLNILFKWIARYLVKAMPQKLTGVGEEPAEEEKKPKQNAALRVYRENPIGMILGGVCGLLLFCVALVPLVGVTDMTHGVATAAISLADEEGDVPTIVNEIMDQSVNNAGSATVRFLGGRALYRSMTSYRVGEEKIYLDSELHLVGSLVCAIADVSDAEATPLDKGAAFRNVESALRDSTLVPMVGAELTSAASESWLADEAYHGIKMPSAEGYDSLLKAIVRSQKNATVVTFREDMGTVVRMFVYLAEQDAVGRIKGDAMALLGDAELTEGLLQELLENPRLYVTVGSALDLGVDKLADNLHMHKSRDLLYGELCTELKAVERLPDGATDEQKSETADRYKKVLESYGIAVENDVCLRAAEASAVPMTDMPEWFAAEGVVSADTMSEKSELVTASELEIVPVVVQNKNEEAKQLSLALSTMASVSNQASAHDMDVADLIVDFGPALDALAQTETVGREKSGKIFKGVLQSKKISEQIGFSTLEASDAADTINVNAHRSSYAVQLLSLSQTVRVIRNAGTAEGEAAIQALINDLTPESASTLQTISTPSVMMNHGVPEKSAEPVSGMMSDMFGNLSDAKEEGNMTDEQLQKETAAVNKVMTMSMNVGNSNGAVFGEGSVTGTSADRFVSDILDSEVVSQTVVEQVYGEGNEPTNDPLKSDRTMTGAEENELLHALNDKWTNATDEQRADENYKKQLVSIAALMNVAVEVNESGVTKAA